MTDFTIHPSSEQDKEWVTEQLMSFNRQVLTLSREEYIIPLSFHIRLPDEQVIAGINATMIGKSSVFVSILWVHPEHRQHRYGSLLLSKVEDEAKALGGKLIHLDTLDFQAKGFYLKQGYELYAELPDSPVEGRRRFYLRKYLG